MNIFSRLAATGIGYGSEGAPSWRVAHAPFGLSVRQRLDLAQVTADCHQFLLVVHSLIMSGHPVGDEIVATLGGDPLRVELAKLPVDNPVPMIRPDAFWDDRGHVRVVEVETMIGGFGMSHALGAAYETTSFPGTAHGYAKMMGHVRGEEDCQPRIVVVNPASKSGYDQEFQVFARALLSQGICLETARPNEIHLDGEVVLFREQPVDILHRFFRLSELRAEYPESLEPLVAIARRRLVPIVQPWCEVLEEKGLMAFFHRDDLLGFWRGLLGDECWARLAHAIPRTWLVRDLVGTDFWEQLKKSTPSTRPYWIKKSGNAWGGRDVVRGPGLSTTKWQGAMASCEEASSQGEHYVLQLEPTPWQPEIHFYTEDVVGSQAMHLRVNPFGFVGPAGLGVDEVTITARRDPKVHGAKDSVLLPTSFLPS